MCFFIEIVFGTIYTANFHMLLLLQYFFILTLYGGLLIDLSLKVDRTILTKSILLKEK